LNKIKHTINLKGFNLEKGKISLSLLEKLSNHLISLAESTMLSFIEGKSYKKRGKLPDWLSKSLDFQLTGIKEGSTILELEAPQLSETLDAIPQLLFEDIQPDEITNNSALGFSMYAYEQVVNEKYDSYLLDKNLLKEMSNFDKFLAGNDSQIIITNQNNQKSSIIKREYLEKIKNIEIKTPEPIRTRITGVLDLIKHSNEQLELLVNNKRIRAYLSDKVSLNDIIKFFGKEISVLGLINYKPSNEAKSIEIHSFETANDNDTFFKTIPESIKEEIDLKQLASKQNYIGTEIDSILGKWPGDESIEELIESVK
jgi:hypothetical protein